MMFLGYEKLQVRTITASYTNDYFHREKLINHIQDTTKMSYDQPCISIGTTLED